MSPCKVLEIERGLFNMLEPRSIKFLLAGSIDPARRKAYTDMSSALEEEMKTVLNGGAASLPDTYDLVSESPRPLKLRNNVCYIVMGILLNDQDEVLMMQEAKAECLGTWYLPAGRLERGETLVDGLCREVQEETGLTCEPITLLAVEERGATWVRFVFLAQHTGGTLKSLASADKESLQASWWDRVTPLPLRGRDILPLIKLGLEYRQQPSHPNILPQLYPSPFLILRMLLVCIIKPGEMWVLQSASDPERLPTAICATHGGSIMNPLRNLLHDPPKSYGLLGVQHQGGDGADGICLTIMGVFIVPELPQVRVDRLIWVVIEDEGLMNSIKKAKLLPLYS